MSAKNSRTDDRSCCTLKCATPWIVCGCVTVGVVTAIAIPLAAPIAAANICIQVLACSGIGAIGTAAGTGSGIVTYNALNNRPLIRDVVSTMMLGAVTAAIPLNIITIGAMAATKLMPPSCLTYRLSDNHILMNLPCCK